MNKFEVRSMDLYYGSFHALKNINIDIPEKEITAFIGPSGCGKSTFLKSLNRMNDLVEGSPRNPTPLITCAPSRARSAFWSKFIDIYSLVSITKADPRHTNACVLIPAPRRFNPRSIPITVPVRIASARRPQIATLFHSAIASIKALHMISPSHYFISNESFCAS